MFGRIKRAHQPEAPLNQRTLFAALGAWILPSHAPKIRDGNMLSKRRGVVAAAIRRRRKMPKDSRRINRAA